SREARDAQKDAYLKGIKPVVAMQDHGKIGPDHKEHEPAGHRSKNDQPDNRREMGNRPKHNGPL
ncbi:MAG: hypothetical protein EBZ34_05235, partial [Flavobacteriia bacterium]|nr:hypothetical protein [Flavobacteriia bacterium]